LIKVSDTASAESEVRSPGPGGELNARMGERADRVDAATDSRECRIEVPDA
jgi:hypothetical protein